MRGVFSELSAPRKSPLANDSDDKNTSPFVNVLNRESTGGEQGPSDPNGHIVELNHDVLCCVMASMGSKDFATRDLLSMMLTCRLLYGSGILVLLRRPVYLDQYNIVSFCDYMLKDIDFRGPLLRHVFLRHSASHLTHEADLERLSTILKQTRNLKTFSASDSEKLVKRVPDMVDTLDMLPHLTELELWSAGNCAIQLLKQLSRKLVILSASLVNSTPIDIPYLTLPRLEQLTLHSIGLQDWEGSFPSLRRLVLEVDAVYDCTLSNLAHLFPRLQNLVLHRHHTVHNLNQVQLWRQENERQHASISQLWSELDEVEGDLANIFALAIPCPIRKLRLSECILDHPQSFIWLTTLIADCQPNCLSFDIKTDRLDLNIFAQCDGLVAAAPHLNSFQMIIRFCNNFDEVLDINAFLDVMLHFIRCSSLNSIELHLLADPVMHVGHPTVKALRHLSSTTLAGRVRDAVASDSLRRIFLAIIGRGRTRWEVSSKRELVRCVW
ncbi:unnamed protein product [Somion occarium]|uniref:Uncharacterized protein n=1 Tax=Somion occarium TaxID=3059160 RepID=A0ABP1CSB8_9APHY